MENSTIEIELVETLVGKEVTARATTHKDQWCAEIVGSDGDTLDREPLFEQRGIDDPKATSKFRGGSCIDVSDGDVFELADDADADNAVYVRVDGTELVEIGEEEI